VYPDWEDDAIQNDEDEQVEGEGFWKTREGEIISVKKMTDSHLINTYKLILNKSKKLKADTLRNMHEFSGYLSGEYALLEIENEIEQLENEDPKGIFKACPVPRGIFDEIVRRGLEIP
jgi:hypothetical protein